jgi:GntR family transcriptional regulator
LKRPVPAALLRSGSGTLYVQLATLLRQMIHAGQWRPGDRLPSIKELVRQYGVAQVTVSQSLAILQNEGLVERRQGKGTFVADDIGERTLWLELESNWDSIIQIWKGSEPTALEVRDTIGSPPLEPKDGKPAPAYRYMRRVHAYKNTPYTVIDIHLDRRLYVQAPKDFDEQMVIPLLEKLPGVEIKFARQTLSISTADLDTAHLLNIPVNSPVGLVRRVLQDQHGVVIYLGSAIYRGDMVKLERILVK